MLSQICHSSVTTSASLLCSLPSTSSSFSKSNRNPFQWRKTQLQIQCQVSQKMANSIEKNPTDSPFAVVFDNDSDESHTIIHITAPGRPGLLQLVVSAMKDLGLDVAKATVDYENGSLIQKLWVDERIQDSKDIKNLQKVLLNAIIQQSPVREKPAKRLPSKLYTKQELLPSELAEFQKRTDLIFGLMDQYLKNDVYSIQKSIIGHVEYTIARSRFRFDDFEAYQVTCCQCCIRKTSSQKEK